VSKRGSEVVAVILAGGLVFAINVVTLAVLWGAISSDGPGLSDNATQVLVTAFGGIIGLLGAFVGYRVGQATAPPPPEEPWPAWRDRTAELPPNPAPEKPG
jgi:hypothetical protein